MNNIILDMFVSKSYPYLNLSLDEKEFYEIESFIKKHCFIMSNKIEEDKFEYKKEIVFLYKGNTLALREYRSYGSGYKQFVLSKNV